MKKDSVMQALHSADPARLKTSVSKRSSPTSSPIPTSVSCSVCGTEVKGHLAGQTMIALHKNGVKEGRVVGAEGAIPFIENLNDTHIKRFQEQVECVNIMESEDLSAIKAKMNELKARDPGAFAADPIVVEVKEAAGGIETAAAGANPQFLEIEKRLDKIEKKIEFVDAEVAQRVGRKIGRDIGILYGLVAGLTVFVMLLFFVPEIDDNGVMEV